MVRIDKRTNIFNLIKNDASTVKDFKELYELSPEKFKLKFDDMDIIEYANYRGRNDLVKYFESVIQPSITYSIISLLNKKPYLLKKFLEDKDLKTLSNEDQVKIIERLFIDENKITDRYHKIVLLLDKGINVNTILANEASFIPEYFTDISMFKHIIDTYNFNVNMKNRAGISFLLKYLLGDYYEEVKYLLGKIENINEKINNHGYLYYIYNEKNNSIPRDDREKYYKLFLEHGVDPDERLNETEDYTLLIIAIHLRMKDMFDLLLEKGANINKVASRNITPLSLALLINDIYFVRKLIEKGANVNQLINIPPHPVLLTGIIGKIDIDIIKLLIDSGADKTAKFTKRDGTIIDALGLALTSYEKDNVYFGKVIELLGGKIPKKELWKGVSRSDIEKFDLFFEKPFDWSTCPVCLEYIERSDGCMYMSHDCATTGHYYHKKLYNLFMYKYGVNKVEWCTICGRITENHKHFKLSQAQDASKEKAPLQPEIQARLDRGDNLAFFDNANCVGFGGGGTEEKATRFRRLREYALELQEDVDKKFEDEVLAELIEEVWNAPLVRNKKIKKILEDKRWNINVKEFPENKRNSSNNNNDKNAANIPFNGRKPTIVDEDCIIFGEDNDTNTRETNPKFQFHHETVGGQSHDGIYICQKDLAQAVQIKCAEFGLEDFGKCWFSMCKGVLHPEELKDIIPELLYEEYRKKFNKKMKQKGGNQTRKLKKYKGGNVKSILHELKDGTCASHNSK